MVGSIVPQGGSAAADVSAWASEHPAIEPIVRALGLHAAFSSPLFIAIAAVLGLSTALCAWRRTKVALHRSGTLRRSSLADDASIQHEHDFAISLPPGVGGDDALSTAAYELKALGVKTKRRSGVLEAVSGRWTAWGSPIFHWALLGLLVVLLVGNSLRAEGLMGVAVGQIKSDTPQSYGIFHAGLLRSWVRVHRFIRVDQFEIDYRTGGVDRGPTPTVSLLDGNGKLIKQQRVYPNHTLKSGSLTIYPSAYGLAATISQVNASGQTVGTGTQLVDFSTDASGGTVPVGGIAVLNSSGAMAYRATVTVPLDQGDGGTFDQVPANPSATIVVTDSDGKVVARDTIAQGKQLAVPGDMHLLLNGVTYYARLQVVDDWTVPLLYAGLLVALVGLAIATLARQQIVLVTIETGSEGSALLVRCQLWRNATTSRSEIESELRRVFGKEAGTREGSVS